MAMAAPRVLINNFTGTGGMQGGTCTYAGSSHFGVARATAASGSDDCMSVRPSVGRGASLAFDGIGQQVAEKPGIVAQAATGRRGDVARGELKISRPGGRGHAHAETRMHNHLHVHDNMAVFDTDTVTCSYTSYFQRIWGTNAFHP